MQLLFTGDFYIADEYKDKNLIDQSIIDLFMKADYRFLNLEAPITINVPSSKILKTGPNLRMTEEIVIPVLKQLKIDALNLANNHIMDYGEKGLLETINTLKVNDIEYVGAGENLSTSQEPLTIEKNGTKIAVLNFCENEWSIAGKKSAGANPLDPIENIKQIQCARKGHHKVICVVHGGLEYLGIPSPRVVKLYRNLIDFGADAVISHHTHQIGAFEIYNNAPIVYGLGNFLFTMKSRYSSWYLGLVAELEINNNSPINCKFKVISQNSETFRLTIASKELESQVFKQIVTYSKVITNDDKHEELWGVKMLERKNEYLSLLSPTSMFKNRWMNSLLWRSRIYRLLISKRHSAMLLNLCRCEAHAEAIQFILKHRIIL